MFGVQNRGTRKASDKKDSLRDPPDLRSRLSVGSVPPPPLNMVGRDSGDRKQYRWEFQGLRGMRGTAKLLKRNKRACKEILLLPRPCSCAGR